jgi:hypothetical protein
MLVTQLRRWLGQPWQGKAQRDGVLSRLGKVVAFDRMMATTTASVTVRARIWAVAEEFVERRGAFATCWPIRDGAVPFRKLDRAQGDDAALSQR